MYLFELEKLSKENKNGFIRLIDETYSKQGLNEAIRLIKKSGICVNPYGTGKPKENALYKDVIKLLNDREPEAKQLKDFEAEINTINTLYKKFTDMYLSKTESSLPSDVHVTSYLIALELHLTELQKGMMRDLYYGNVNGLNNNQSDIYENIVQNTGVVLKYFLYKQYPFAGISKRIPKQSLRVAGEHFKNSEMKFLLDTIMELWNYFEADIQVDNNGEVTIKSIGEGALGKHISHLGFMDIRNAKMSRHGYEEYLFNTRYSNTNILPPHSYISSNEKTACDFIEEYFSTTDLSIEFNGISLAELTRAYSIAAQESEKFIRNRKTLRANFNEIALNDVCITKSKYKWINKFVEMGIRKSKAEEILNFMTFDATSNDILECPFIKMENDYVLIPTATYLTDFSRAILLNLSSRGINVSIKGNEFEKLIRQSVNNSNLRCVHLEKKDYECDAVFAIGTDLFFVETKHLSHPTSYREYIRNLDEIYDACVQLERIVNYYTQSTNIEEIKSLLNMDSVSHIHKMVVTNTSQGEKLKINGTHVVDDTYFVGYFERRSPQIVQIEGDTIIASPLFEEYYKGQVNAEQFIDLIEKSPLLQQKKRRIGYHTFNYSEQLGLKFDSYFVKVNTTINPELLSDEEMDKLNSIFNE